MTRIAILLFLTLFSYEAFASESEFLPDDEHSKKFFEFVKKDYVMAKNFYKLQMQEFNQEIADLGKSRNQIKQKNTSKIKRIEVNKIQLQEALYKCADDLFFFDNDQYDKDVALINIMLSKAYFYSGTNKYEDLFSMAKEKYETLISHYEESLQEWVKIVGESSNIFHITYEKAKKARLERHFGGRFPTPLKDAKSFCQPFRDVTNLYHNQQ